MSQPPIVDLTFRQSQSGDRNVDVLVEQTRLNLSVGFLAAMARFTLDAMPGEGGPAGIVNPGYIGDLGVPVRTSVACKARVIVDDLSSNPSRPHQPVCSKLMKTSLCVPDPTYPRLKYGKDRLVFMPLVYI